MDEEFGFWGPFMGQQMGTGQQGSQFNFGMSGNQQSASNGWLSSLLGGGNNLNGLSNQNAGGFMGDLSQGIGAFSNLANTWLGYQQYRQARDQMRFNEDLTRTNLRNQANTVNQSIADRNNARLAFSPNQYQPTEQVLSQFGVSGEVGG